MAFQAAQRFSTSAMLATRSIFRVVAPSWQRTSNPWPASNKSHINADLESSLRASVQNLLTGIRWVVGFSKDDRLVRQVAKRQAVTNPENTLFSINRFMGRKQAAMTFSRGFSVKICFFFASRLTL